MNKLFTILITLILISIINNGCSDPVDIISPTHYARVPRPVNLTAVADTTVTGKDLVTLNWGVNSTDNIRNYEVYRAANRKQGFASLIVTAEMAFADSLFGASDTLAYYYISPNGIDRFVGQNSDTIQVTLLH